VRFSKFSNSWRRPRREDISAVFATLLEAFALAESTLHLFCILQQIYFSSSFWSVLYWILSANASRRHAQSSLRELREKFVTLIERPNQHQAPEEPDPGTSSADESGSEVEESTLDLQLQPFLFRHDFEVVNKKGRPRSRRPPKTSPSQFRLFEDSG